MVWAKRKKIWMFEITLIGGLKKSKIFTCKMWAVHPTSFLMPFLESSWNYLSEKVYFCMDRVNIFKVMTIFIPIGALLFDFGDVTKMWRVQDAWPYM